MALEPTIHVAPVTTYKATTRSVYLPSTPGGWYLFWTGAAAAGGATVSAPAPFDAMPVYARAGSIVPLGPDLQYTSEKPADPITFYVYAGADGSFTLYEDQGTTNDYENAAFTEIPIKWTDATKTLTIGARQGSFTGMLASRDHSSFEAVFGASEIPAGTRDALERVRAERQSGFCHGLWVLAGLSRSRRVVYAIPAWSTSGQLSHSPPSSGSEGGGRAG